MARKTKPCPWCGRHRGACWIMPCLALGYLLHRAPTNKRFELRLFSWARAGGLDIRRAS